MATASKHPEEPLAPPHPVVEADGADPAPAAIVRPGSGGGIKRPATPPEETLAEPPEEPPQSLFQKIENERVGGRQSIFDNLENLRIAASEDDGDLGEEVLTSVAIRRPGKRALRAHKDEKYQFEAYILEDVKDKIVYYVIPSVGDNLVDQPIENFKHVILVLCIGKSKKMFFWPIPAKGNFRGSGLKAVDIARTDWVKAVGNLEAGGYEVSRMPFEEYGEPAWPKDMPSIEELLKLAFHDNIITSPHHPAIKRAKNV